MEDEFANLEKYLVITNGVGNKAGDNPLQTEVPGISPVSALEYGLYNHKHTSSMGRIIVLRPRRKGSVVYEQVMEFPGAREASIYLDEIGSPIPS